MGLYGPNAWHCALGPRAPHFWPITGFAAAGAMNSISDEALNHASTNKLHVLHIRSPLGPYGAWPSQVWSSSGIYCPPLVALGPNRLCLFLLEIVDCFWPPFRPPNKMYLGIFILMIWLFKHPNVVLYISLRSLFQVTLQPKVGIYCTSHSKNPPKMSMNSKILIPVAMSPYHIS